VDAYRAQGQRDEYKIQRMSMVRHIDTGEIRWIRRQLEDGRWVVAYGCLCCEEVWHESRILVLEP
jgi:hypothetical protein